MLFYAAKSGAENCTISLLPRTYKSKFDVLRSVMGRKVFFSCSAFELVIYLNYSEFLVTLSVTASKSDQCQSLVFVISDFIAHQCTSLAFGLQVEIDFTLEYLSGSPCTVRFQTVHREVAEPQ